MLRPSMTTGADETATLLARVPVFETLTENDLRRVADVSVPRRFGAGEVIFREGDDSDTCYVVNAGHARALREHADGRQITLATFGPGDIFGELAMFDAERRSATVEATDDLEVLGILGGDMRRLLRRHPDMSVKLVISLGRRLRAANERLARQSFQTVQSRVAACSPNSSSRPRRRERASATSRWSPPRPTSPSWPAPRASPPAASWPCSSAQESSPRAAAASPSMTRRRSEAMSTDRGRPSASHRTTPSSHVR